MSATRPLKRMKIPKQTLAKLQQRKVTTAVDLLVKTELELNDLLDLSSQDVFELQQVVSSAITPAPKTAFELLQESRTRVAPSLALHNPALHIGIGVSELVGSAGMGKTQACLTLAASAALPHPQTDKQGGVIYIDTEQSFSPTRLLEIAASRYPAQFGTHEALERLSTSVTVFSPASPAELGHRLDTLEELILAKNVQLIVVDSVAAPVRSRFSAQQGIERQKFLGSVASKLKYLGERFRIPVVVTNQVTTMWGKGGSAESYLIAALGIAWAHAVNTRFVLDVVQDQRRLTIVKSPHHACTSWPYNIVVSGVVVEDSVSESISKSVLSTRIST
eukprot:gb/GEZN01009915.1/.p1 GENE.gb/GEZN01009915.1/~~gb/GEZN01009915.1/.p1  ORF type:complete len:334 (-),score=29.01 gb/GEZN01009915.1/:213-1214(-)